jgi:hypothetical protein
VQGKYWVSNNTFLCKAFLYFGYMQDNHYLQKHAIWPRLIQSIPAPSLSMVVVIPAYAEDKVLYCLESLCRANRVPEVSIEVLVVINHPESASAEAIQLNEDSHVAVTNFAQHNPKHWITFYSLYIGALPNKQAGVGMARKVGMDEAVRRLTQAGGHGIIVNLDADCSVSSNYFQAIWEGFLAQSNIWAASIYFEHPFLQNKSNEEIISYEMHLRYFIAVQRYIGLPFSFHTVGSSMAVRSDAYQKMGGMNTRKAGEDFYFLHKFSAINRLGEINTTVVLASARSSFRVPFGTGRAISAQLAGSPQLTYHLESFLEVRKMVDSLPTLYETESVIDWIERLPSLLGSYFERSDALVKLEEIRRETNRFQTFRNRFFQWFNAFRLMKFLHFARSVFPDIPVYDQALAFANLLDKSTRELNARELLLWYRHHDREQRNPLM